MQFSEFLNPAVFYACVRNRLYKVGLIRSMLHPFVESLLDLYEEQMCQGDLRR